MSPVETDKLAAVRNALGMSRDEFFPHNARINLLGALVDIQNAEGHADSGSISTINRVLGQLAAVENILKGE